MATADTGSRLRPWLKIVLFGSLALNLLVVGMVAGMLLRGPDHRGFRDGRDPVTPYTRAFTDEQRRALGRALRAELAARGGGALMSDYRDALAVLRAEPFDPAALEAVLERQADRAEARRQAGQRVLRDAIAGMAPAERAAFADRLEARLDDMAERRGRWSAD